MTQVDPHICSAFRRALSFFQNGMDDLPNIDSMISHGRGWSAICDKAAEFYSPATGSAVPASTVAPSPVGAPDTCLRAVARDAADFLSKSVNMIERQSDDDAGGYASQWDSDADEMVAALRIAIAEDQHEEKYPECSGDPTSCPENEGYGCCQPNPIAAQAPKPASGGGWRSVLCPALLYPTLSKWLDDEDSTKRAAEQAAAALYDAFIAAEADTAKPKEMPEVMSPDEIPLFRQNWDEKP